MTLDEIQQLFSAAIRFPTGVSDFLAAADAETRRRFAEVFDETPALGRRARVDIYANAYFRRLLDALAASYPRLAELAGPAPFNDFVTDYLLACPPSEPDLRRAGDRLPAFVRTHPLGAELPMTAALADVEQALDRALDCPDGERLERAELERLEPRAWPALGFSLSEPTRLVRVDVDIVEVARRLALGDRLGAREVPRAPAPLVVLVGRRGHATYFRRLADAEATLLAAIAAGASFGEACAELAGAGTPLTEAGPQQVAGYLLRWVEDGVLAALVSS